MPRVSGRVYASEIEEIAEAEVVRRGRRRLELVSPPEWSEKPMSFRTPPLKQPLPLPKELIDRVTGAISIFDRPLSNRPPPASKSKESAPAPVPVDPEQRKRELETRPLNVPTPVLKQFIARVLGSRIRLDGFLEIRLLHRLKHHMELAKRFSQKELMEDERAHLREEVNALFRQGEWIDCQMLNAKGLFVRRVTRKGHRFYFAIHPHGFIAKVYTSKKFWNAMRDHQANRRRFLRQYDA